MHNPYRQTRFQASAPDLRDLPPDTGREVTFAGRSNVGKSSVLNRVTEQRKLARTSGTPGRTQAINIFEVDDDVRLTDLPGFGYAKVPLSVKKRWERVLPEYLARRNSLKGVILVMDLRHAPTPLDEQMLAWAAAAGVPVHGVLTKADKLKAGARKKRLQEASRAARSTYGEALPVQAFSALDGFGVETLVETLNRWLFDSESGTFPMDAGPTP